MSSLTGAFPAPLYIFKIRGLTAASATIATVDVSVDADGYLRYPDGTTNTYGVANVRAIQIKPEISDLLSLIFAGVDGVAAGSSGVNGYRFFGEPVLLQ